MRYLVIKESENSEFNEQYPVGSIIEVTRRGVYYYTKDIIDPTKADWYLTKMENFKWIKDTST